MAGWVAVLGNKRLVAVERQEQRSISVMAQAEYKWAVACNLSRVLRRENSWVVLDKTVIPLGEAVAAQVAVLAHFGITPAHTLMLEVELVLLALISLSYCQDTVAVMAAEVGEVQRTAAPEQHREPFAQLPLSAILI